MTASSEVPLPQEVLDEIIDSAARSSSRRSDCARFCLISKQFYRPALRSLLKDVQVVDQDQCDALLASWSRNPFQPPLVCTRRLFLRIGGHGSRALADESAASLLQVAPHLQALGMQASQLPTTFFSSMPAYPFLRRLEVDSPLPIAAESLITAVTAMPRLERLSVRHLLSAPESTLDDFTLPLRTLTLQDSSISDADLLLLARACEKTLRSFVLHGCKTVHKEAMVEVLSLVGPGLGQLELRSCHFLDDPAANQHMGAFFDRVPDLCPFLLELQICSDAICTVGILQRALARMPLRHVELNCRLPHFDPDDVIEALALVPLGRLETLFIGPHLKWHDIELDQLKRVCHMRGVTFSAGMDLVDAADPPSEEEE